MDAVAQDSFPEPSGAMPVYKWAGAPSDNGGGAGGSNTNPKDEAYDPSKKPTPFTEVGASGLAQYGGFVREEFLPALQGDNARKVYREMYDNDAIVGGVVMAIQMLLRKTEWRVEPAEAGSVEEIVEERMAERAQAAQEQQQAQQQRLMEQQAALAGGAQGTNARGAGPNGKKPGAPAPPPMGRSGLAAGALNAPLGIHQGISPVGGPASTAATPPSDPGSNQPLPTRTNQPDVTGVPNSQGSDPTTNPGTNPGGGPAQAAALAGNFGVGTESKPDDGKRKSLAKRIAGALVRSDVEKAAGSGGGGGGTASLDAGSVGANPVDPETGEPMEFAIGQQLQDITPEAREAEELAVFVETCLHDMADPWADCLSQIVTMIVFGFSYHEIVYKKRNGPNPDLPYQGSRFTDGKVGWANLAGRAQETLFRWEFDDNGNIVGFWQLAPPKFQLRYIPLSKAILFRTTAYKNNPEGRSVFRSAYRSWFLKKRIEEYEAIGVERDLAGLPVFGVPYQLMTEGATPAEKATLEAIKEIVKNVRLNQQGGVVMPLAYDPDTGNPLYTFTLLSSDSSAKSMDTDKIIARYEQRMAMTALADILLLGHEAVGSQSLGNTKMELFTAALGGWLDSIADAINTMAIPKLMQINGEDPAMCPKLTHGKLATISLTDIGALITALSGAGADLFPDAALEDYIREEAGLPPKAASQDL